MKIFSFPFLVIKELVEQLEPVELIALTLCSKNAHALVKTLAKTNQDLRIDLSFYYDEYFISFRRDPMHVSIRVTSNQPRFCSPLKSIHGLNYCFDKTGRLYTCWQDVVQGCQKTTNYVCDLLKIPVTTISIYREEDLWLLDFAQQRQEQKLKNVHVCTLDVNMSAEGYSSTMSFNATERLIVTAGSPLNYRFVGKLSASKTLFIYRGVWITGDHLLGLESSNAILLQTELRSADINALLRVWLNGGLPNLKYLEIEQITLNNPIYEGVRDRLEPVQGKISYKWDESDVKFNTNAVHLRREDNVVATVSINAQTFIMAVWPDVYGNRV